jgi:hypothetical protein
VADALSDLRGVRSKRTLSGTPTSGDYETI